MTGTPGIMVDGLWKKFQRGDAHDSLRDLIPALFRRRPRTEPDLVREEFWALRDVNFDVGPGDALGIIGSNGAGKSTLLKVLTRVMRPTRGRCDVRGRVGALIEVAAGFHPDLTGRENVFLQGAIMGLHSRDTAKRLDDIVDFAGIGAFLDTPVKRYSSGMNARLGFAIAVHLEPDVLIVDEVLAVGDAAFQERAFERLSQIVRSGIPVVVVSHQLPRVASLCTRAILLEQGRVTLAGKPGPVIAAYAQSGREYLPADDAADAASRVARLSLESDAPVRSGDWIEARIDGTIVRTLPTEVEPVGIRLRSTTTGEVVFRTSNVRLGAPISSPGNFSVVLHLQLNVPPGTYFVEVQPWDGAAGRQTQASLIATVTVVEGVPFLGTVQLNARLQSATPPDASRQ